MKKVVAVIPARYGSTRFPGKPLVPIAGKPMIQHVYEAAAAATRIDAVIVATDDQRIMDAVTAFGGTAVITSSEHETGTDRIAEAVTGLEADIVLNIQGDEPLIPSAILNQLAEKMQHSDADMGTVAVPFSCVDRDPTDSNAVKVVLDNQGFALYFSRALIPFLRSGGEETMPLLHWGLYAYTRQFLQRFVSWPRGRLERSEMLEQLRALENGARILVLQTKTPTLGVDVPEDVDKVEAILKSRNI